MNDREREKGSPAISPDYDAHRTLTRTRKPRAAVMLSAAEKGVGEGEVERKR
jgi:hypothetical protein